MNTTNNTPLIITFLVIVLLFLLFGGGAMTGGMMNGGMHENGWLSDRSWMWIPALITLSLGCGTRLGYLQEEGMTEHQCV